MTAAHIGIPGIDPNVVTPVPLDGDQVRGSASIPVHAPYDGSLLGLVPSLTATDVDRAVDTVADPSLLSPTAGGSRPCQGLFDESYEVAVTTR